MKNNGKAGVSPRSTMALAYGLTVVGALARLIPHPANFTPVGGMSLFAGARLRGWHAYLVPLLLMAVTDPILGAMYGFPAYSRVTFAIYGSFLINVWIGRRLRTRQDLGSITTASLICSVQFFVLTNAGVWLAGGLYPLTGAGLVSCYVAAIPFFGRTLAAQLLYATLLFGLHAWLGRLLHKKDAVLLPDVPAA